jgi:hypothetical protein
MNFENLNKFLKPFNRINQLGKKKKTYIGYWADLNFGPLATGRVARPAHGPNGLGRHNVGGSRLQGVRARPQGGPKGQASWAARRADGGRGEVAGGWRRPMVVHCIMARDRGDVQARASGNDGSRSSARRLWADAELWALPTCARGEMRRGWVA